jgi:acetyl esterase/lipase
MPLDPQAQAYLDRLAALGMPPVGELPVAEARAAMEATAAPLFGPTDPVGSVMDQAVPGPAGPIRMRIYEPPGDDRESTRDRPIPRGGRDRPLLTYFHGGGWVVCSLDTHEGICRALASRTPCVVASVDYRLAPEHRFPAAVEDAWAATAWLAEHAASLGADPGRIAVGGDSAGGNLAAVVALRARDRGLPLTFQLLVYPVCDDDLDRPSYREYASGYGLTREGMRSYWDHYLGPDDRGRGSDPEASPLRAENLAGVAPALVLTAEFDPLRDEGEEYARALERAGVAVTLSRYDGLIHGFYRMPAVIDRAQLAHDESAAALRAAFSRVARTPESSGTR